MFLYPETAVAVAAARKAAAVLLRQFRGPVEVRQKQACNLVTDVDLESEAVIVRELQSAFPGHRILGEESAADTGDPGEHLWIIDPLDGTSNFVHGIDQFGISIGYYRDNRPVTGVVVRPVSDEWFVAEQGGGATRNGRPVSVSPATELNEVLLGVGFYYDRDRKMRATLAAMEKLYQQEIRGFRRMGAAALDLCMVGCGQLGGYFEFQLAPWDFAAGRLFVEEAGGCVTCCAGQPLPLRTSSILASNGTLHPQLLHRIEPVWRELS
jgi:myo-inositol-1(or 4)-monophosphatase